MFKAKYLPTGEIFQVLAVKGDELTQTTYFFIWNNDGWRWYSAKNFIPPNYEKVN